MLFCFVALLLRFALLLKSRFILTVRAVLTLYDGPVAGSAGVLVGLTVAQGAQLAILAILRAVMGCLSGPDGRH